MEIRFKGKKLIPEIKYYENGNIKINLLHNDNVFTTATVDIDKKLPYGYAFINNISDNQGIVESLLSARFIYSEYVDEVIYGSIKYRAYKITDYALNFMNFKKMYKDA